MNQRDFRLYERVGSAVAASNSEQTTHHLDAESVSMRIDKLISSPSLAGDFVRRHGHFSRLSLT